MGLWGRCDHAWEKREMLTEFESEIMKRHVGKSRHGWEVNM
jgi:HD-GYP domain-containing protein (c-di-GMP phosphodiesterase class II)